MSASQLSPTMEDYLKTIYDLERSNKVARVKDIARRLKVKMPSVSGAIKALGERELVNHESYGYVTLTSQGTRVAEQISRRHTALVRFLTEVLHIDTETAEEQACGLEHSLQSETLYRLASLVDFIKRCPRAGQQWLAHLQGRWEATDCEQTCADCIASIEVPEKTPFPKIQLTTLDRVQPGQHVRVHRLSGQGAIRRRLMDMGIRSGVELLVERIAPLGDPIEIKLLDYHLSLRLEEAAGIHVEVLE